MKLCFAQLNPTVGDIAGNASKVIAALQDARTQGAELVVFPELVLVGYPPKDLLLQKKFIDANLAALQDILPHTTGITAVIGFVDRTDDALFNAAAVVQDRKLLGVQHKMHLPNYDVFDEKRYFAPARDARLFAIAGTNVGVTICEDVWLDGPVEELARKGAQLVVNISASPYAEGKERIREQNVLSARAAKNKVAIAYCNLIGGQDDLLFDGHSYFFSATGAKLFEAPSFEEGLFTIDIAAQQPRTNGAINDTEHIFKALVLGIRDYFRKNGFTKAVIGLSGGIDSALVAVLAAEALGKENVLGITMPSRFSSAGSVDDAVALAKNLGIDIKTVPIEQVFAAYLSTLSGIFSGAQPNVAEENLQARIRGAILMAISNKFGHLVLSTGNKSELACGYCTLYGDMCGGLAVISDLPKVKVYALARWYNSQRGRTIIPESTIDKAPSAELRPNQKDSDSLPEYDILDPILELFVDQNLDTNAIIGKGHDPATVAHVAKLVRSNEYKRAQAALGLRVTSKAFGSGRRFPITNRWKQ
jgi:NAD+ synthase (glutamine-hydrolysing)